MGVWSFRLLGFPVAVEPWFWLVTLVMGAQGAPESLPPWMLAVFVSILVHELGHAYLGRAYGHNASILLYSFGGVTFFEGGASTTLLREALLALAGPMAGFAFALAVYVFARLVPLDGVFLNTLIGDLLWVNIAWGLINLLPVLPLDGGHVMRAAVHAWKRRSDDTLALRISVAVGGAMAAVALAYNFLYTAGFFGFMAYQNYQSLQRRPPWRVYGRREP